MRNRICWISWGIDFGQLYCYPIRHIIIDAIGNTCSFFIPVPVWVSYPARLIIIDILDVRLFPIERNILTFFEFHHLKLTKKPWNSPGLFIIKINNKV
jgi:hypothetical protein